MTASETIRRMSRQQVSDLLYEVAGLLFHQTLDELQDGFAGRVLEPATGGGGLFSSLAPSCPVGFTS